MSAAERGSPWRMSARFPFASALALCVLCAADSFGLAKADARFYVVTLVLCLCVGLVHGALWGMASQLIVRLPVRGRAVVWYALSLALTAWFSFDNSLPAMLRGNYPWLAAGLMAATLVGNCAVATLALGAHDTAGDAPGFLSRLPLRLRRGVALGLAALVGVAFWVDHNVYAQLYPHLHTALRVLSLWLATFALVLGSLELRLPRPSTALWLVPLLAALGLGKVDAQALGLGKLQQKPWPAHVLELARSSTDVDGDGYSAFFGGGDCQAWNDRVFPGARELPDNGVDDNCMLGDASRKVVAEERLPVPTTPSPMDVVLITVDALRPDHLGIYNPKYNSRGRGTSPELDRFATHASVFTQAFSPGGSTNIAIGAMLRGVYPRRLQWTGYFETNRFKFARKREEVPAGQRITTMFPLAFDDSRKPIAVFLKQRGMYTAAVLDDGYSEMLSSGTGIERGFSQFVETDTRPASERDDKGTADLVLRTLRQAPKGRRMFLWAHFFGTHNPNSVHPGAREYGKSLADGYDHEINYLDKQLGRVFDELTHWPRPVAVIVTADHGDVMQSGRYHGYTIVDDVVRIPMIARVPGWAPGRSDAIVSLIDVLPTILELTETPAPAYLDGKSLRTQLGPPGTRPTRIVFSDTWLYSPEQKPRVERSAAYDSEGKLLLDRLTQERRVERVDDPAQEVDVARRLGRALDGYLEDTGGTIALTL